jgi:AraC-like DNA-binding protein
MNTVMARNKHYPSLHTENAIAVVRDIIAALRRRGLKSEHALVDLARDLGIARKRVRTLFYRDGEPVVLSEEWHSLRLKAAALLRREAAEQRRRADETDARAYELEHQLDFWADTWADQNGCASRQECDG